MRNLTLMLVIFSIQTVFSQANFEVLFEHDKSDIPPAMQTALRDFISCLPQPMTHFQVLLKGHTDSDGDFNYNEKLSARRSVAVQQWLTEQGMPAGQIHLKYYGEYRPVSDNTADEGKAKNRRVELYFDLNREEKVSGIVPETPFAMTSFKAEKGLEYQYDISGTRISIPAGALVDSKGNPVTGKVDIQYREWRNLIDLLSFDGPMTYTENGVEKIFQSAGMFELQAFQNGQPVYLKPGTEATIDFVAERNLPGMELYTLDKDNGKWSKLSNEDIARQYRSASGLSQYSSYNSNIQKIDFLGLKMDTLAVFNQSVAYLYRLAKEEDFYKKEKKYFSNYETRTDYKFKLTPDYMFEAPNVYGEIALKTPPNIDQISQLKLDNIKIKPRGEDYACYYFTLEDRAGSLTELNAFTGCLFAIRKSDRDVGYYEYRATDYNDKGTTLKGCTQSFWEQCLVYGKFCDVRINQKSNAESTTCFVEMKSLLGKNISFPLHLKQKGKWVNSLDCKSVLQNYTVMRQNRDSINVKIRQNALTFSHLFMTMGERNQPLSFWLNKFETQRPEMLKKLEGIQNESEQWNVNKIRTTIQEYNEWASTQTNVVYTKRVEADSQAIASLAQSNDLMNRTPVRNFGITNWDVCYGNYNTVVVNYIKEDGSPLQPSCVTIIDFDKKACVQTIFKDQIIYGSPAKTGIMVNQQGKVYYAAPGAFEACLNNNNALVLRDITDVADSKEKMREVLGL